MTAPWSVDVPALKLVRLEDYSWCKGRAGSARATRSDCPTTVKVGDEDRQSPGDDEIAQIERHPLIEPGKPRPHREIRDRPGNEVAIRTGRRKAAFWSLYGKGTSVD